MLIKRLKAIARLAWTRYKQFGIHSAYIAIKTYLLNVSVKIQNRCLPAKVECPCCNWRGYRFLYLDCGWFIVPQVECPHCKAHERHRFFTLFLQHRPPRFLLNGDKEINLLHFAPEPHFRRCFETAKNIKFFYTDLMPQCITELPSPKFVADIHNLPIADNAFDVIICFHVLEHVQDDRRALKELSRILACDGELLLMVPFMMDQTETIEYGAPQPHIFDHVRGYSPLDFKDRLDEFEFEEVTIDQFLPLSEIKKYKIPCDSQVLYICKKKVRWG